MLLSMEACKLTAVRLDALTGNKSCNFVKSSGKIIYGMIDSTFNQEKLCKEIILESLGSINVFCSADRKEIQHLSQTISELIALQWAGLVSYKGKTQLC
jgi:hypothetical protein